mgnify:CR=1 FL=1
MRKEFKRIMCSGFIIFLIYSCKKESNLDDGNSAQGKYGDYIEKVENNVSKLNSNRKAQREKWLRDIKSNSVYKTLVDSATVSENFLPVLNAISDAIRNTYSNNGESMFGISENISDEIIKSENGEIKMNFVVPVSALSIQSNGGMPKEIVNVFERYRKIFNLYGNAGDLIVDPNGKKIKVKSSYNLSFAFAVFNPNEKEVLDAIYESIQTDNTQWLANSENVYDNEFMVTKSAYMKHLKEVYADSKYLLDVDFEITPEELYADYDSNEVAADEKFKYKKLAIIGTISDIGKDMLDDPYVSFKIDYLQNVTCYFSKEENNLISRLNKEDEITIIGECKGLTLGNVVIKKCKIH